MLSNLRLFRKYNTINHSTFLRDDSIFRQKMCCHSEMTEGELIKLIPLTHGHLDELWEAGKYPEIWAHTTNKIYQIKDMKKYIDTALDSQELGQSIPYVIYDKRAQSIVGSTRYYNIDLKNYNLDIGYTWITPKFQKSYVNTETKLIMLRQAFGIWSTIRVGFRIGPENTPSLKAVERLGAKKEGVLRNTLILENNKLRDSVCFSIIDSEWEEIKINLENKVKTYL
jgi:RimJ/RimL family protein N-acetyltransferase